MIHSGSLHLSGRNRNTLSCGWHNPACSQISVSDAALHIIAGRSHLRRLILLEQWIGLAELLILRIEELINDSLSLYWGKIQLEVYQFRTGLKDKVCKD